MTEHATYRELRRSRSDRMIAGVCGGLGQYFDVNPVFYRIGFVVLTLLGGAGILIYGASVLVIPNDGERDSIAADVLRNHRQRPAALLGLALVTLAGIALLSHMSFRVHSEAFWAIVLLGGALILWSQRRTAHVVSADGTVVVRRRRSWIAVVLVTFGVLAVIAVAAAITIAATYAHLGDGVGDRNYAPATASTLRHEYRLGTGHLALDLSGLTVPPGTTRIGAHVGIGQLEVTVPHDARVRVLGHVRWGDAKILGHDENGHDVDTVLGSPSPQLVIDAHVDVGEIEVNRAVR
jgi:phage shock protein PspC (stress-responsive transcriptional regulator)/predicted membrane protein